MKTNEQMNYVELLEFMKEMAGQGYVADNFKSNDWLHGGVGFTNDEKNIFVLCFFDTSSMTIYPSIPAMGKYREEFDCHLDQFEQVRKEINNAYEHLFSEYERLKAKYSEMFESIKLIK